jgi:hypothetical protein
MLPEYGTVGSERPIERVRSWSCTCSVSTYSMYIPVGSPQIWRSFSDGSFSGFVSESFVRPFFHNFFLTVPTVHKST